MTRSNSIFATRLASTSRALLALCAVLMSAVCATAATARAENVQCFVYDDGYTNVAGPSDAVYFLGPNRACIPDGTGTGTCRRWFGQCYTTVTRQPVFFRTFDDGYTNQSSPHDSIYVPSTNVACIPDGTAAGTCRRWFGLATANNRPVRCALFDDGYASMTASTDAIYFRGIREVCHPDGTGTGTCRKWFGRCTTD